MQTIKLDLKHGVVLIDSMPITTNEKGDLTGAIARLCSAPTETNEGRTQYRLLKKSAVCGKSADAVIEIEGGRVRVVTILFDLIEFFESSILESKILQACAKSLKVNFMSDHPSTAYLNCCEWRQAIFFYDAKQGDLSLRITFQHTSNKPSL